jgi:hypothetical protein
MASAGEGRRSDDTRGNRVDATPLGKPAQEIEMAGQALVPIRSI